MKVLNLVALLVIMVAMPGEGHEPRKYGPIPPPDPAHDTYEGYAAALRKDAQTELTVEQLLAFNRDYFTLIAPRHFVSAAERQLKYIKASPVPYFTLEKLKTEPFYKETITKLITSPNPQNRMLAYMTVASANDSSFNDVIWKSIETEADSDASYWQGTALLYLKDPHTSKLFDFLVAKENFADAHMVPLFAELNKDELRKTAYEKINSSEVKAQILAVQILALTGPSIETEKVVKEVFGRMQGPVRGYAVHTMKALHMGDLKEILAPLLQDRQLQSIAFDALLNSPTEADRQVAESLSGGSGEIPEYVLNAYLTSADVSRQKQFLQLVRERAVPSSYRIYTPSRLVENAAALLPDMRKTIAETRNRQLVPFLIYVLAQVQTPESINLLRQLTSDPDRAVSSAATRMLGPQNGNR